MTKKIENDLIEIMYAAIDAAKPNNNFSFLPNKPNGKTYVFGAGKASASMAKAFEEFYPYHIDSGLVITRYGHSIKTNKIEILEAAHPLPDKNGLEATKKLINIAINTKEEDLVIFLISGGASALLISPINGISFERKQKINNLLLKSGAPIEEINIVRQSFSNVKGGRLLELIKPSKCITYGISDIPGDNPNFIGSGPTYYSNKKSKNPLDILNKYKIKLSKKEILILTSNPLPKGDNKDFYLISTPLKALEAASKKAEFLNFQPVILSDKLVGDASIEGAKMARLALKIKKNKRYNDVILNKPILLLSGGETTVKVSGSGIGGRNTEFLLSMLSVIKDETNIFGISIDTDGIDGCEKNAGAFFSVNTYEKSKNLNLDIDAFLRNNDSFTFFNKINNLIYTGPTLTNVNDFRAILVTPS